MRAESALNPTAFPTSRPLLLFMTRLSSTGFPDLGIEAGADGWSENDTQSAVE
jgi:hypothetical protein